MTEGEIFRETRVPGAFLFFFRLLETPPLWFSPLPSCQLKGSVLQLCRLAGRKVFPPKWESSHKRAHKLKKKAREGGE